MARERPRIASALFEMNGKTRGETSSADAHAYSSTWNALSSLIHIVRMIFSLIDVSTVAPVAEHPVTAHAFPVSTHDLLSVHPYAIHHASLTCGLAVGTSSAFPPP